MNNVIIFPTDTVYGIGCKIFDKSAINRIYQIKNRPLDKPLACLCASLDQIEAIAYVDKDAKKLINEFLPGALTLILKAKEEVYNTIGYKTIGVRIPNNSIALEILINNGPMLTTSVNESGEVPLNEYDQIVKIYAKLVDKIYDTNSESKNIPSTVALATSEEIKVLREGPISKEQIEACLKNK